MIRGLLGFVVRHDPVVKMICIKPGRSPDLFSAPEEIRTPNLLIRNQMLYPLSYGR